MCSLDGGVPETTLDETELHSWEGHLAPAIHETHPRGLGGVARLGAAPWRHCRVHDYSPAEDIRGLHFEGHEVCDYCDGNTGAPRGMWAKVRFSHTAYIGGCRPPAAPAAAGTTAMNPRGWVRAVAEWFW